MVETGRVTGNPRLQPTKSQSLSYQQYTDALPRLMNRFLFLFTILLAHCAAVFAQTGVLPRGNLILRQVHYRNNAIAYPQSVANSADGNVWWAGTDSMTFLYGNDVQGRIFIDKLAPDSTPQLLQSRLFEGKLQVRKIDHLGRGRGIAVL